MPEILIQVYPGLHKSCFEQSDPDLLNYHLHYYSRVSLKT